MRRFVLRLLSILIITILIVEVIPDIGYYLMQRHIATTWAAYYSSRVGNDLALQSEAVTFSIDEDGLAVPDDYHSQYVNIDNGVRRTIGQPDHFNHTVWMFGNSALYGYYVADGDTVASQLQLLIPTYRVINMAFKMDAIAIETARLERTSIRPGDVVIFYDGATDLAQSFVAPSACKVQIGLIRFVCQWISPDSLPAPTIDVSEARRYTERHGAIFFHFWQSLIFAHPLTPAEQAMMDDFNVSTGQHVYASSIWLSQPPADTVSLLHLLDGCGDCWIDWTHVSGRANAVIARALFVALAASVDRIYVGMLE